MKDAFFSSGSSPGSKSLDPTQSRTSSQHNSDPDFTVLGNGCDTVLLLCPESDAARAWVDEHISEDSTRLGRGVAIENRYFWTILLALQDAGFVVVPS